MTYILKLAGKNNLCSIQFIFKEFCIEGHCVLILKVHSKSWKNVLNGILFSWILQKLSKLWISISCLCSPPPSVIISIPAPKVRSTALFCQWKYLIFFFACPQEPFPTPFSLIYFPSLVFQFLIMKKIPLWERACLIPFLY